MDVFLPVFGALLDHVTTWDHVIHVQGRVYVGPLSTQPQVPHIHHNAISNPSGVTTLRSDAVT